MPPWEWKQLEQAYLLALACLGVSRNDTRIAGQNKAGIGYPQRSGIFNVLAVK